MADIKRMRYFDQQLLVLDDFTDEQAYHIGMRQRHNQLLHTPGVARGLEVNKTGVKEVKVKEGMAINEQGQEIALDKESDPIKLDEFASGDRILITIRYKPVEDSPTGDPPQNRRILEKAELKKIKEGAGVPIDSSEVRLARITMGATDIVEPFDLTVRRVAGASAFDNPDAAVTVRSLRISNPASPNTQWPTLTATAANQMTLSGSLALQGLSATGDISSNGSVRASGDLSCRNLSLTGVAQGKLDVRGLLLANKLEITDANGVTHQDNWIGMANNIEGGTKWLHVGGISDSGKRRLALLADVTYVSGNLGIGTTSPHTQLTLTGSIGFTNANTPLMYIYQSGFSNPERPVIAHSPPHPNYGIAYNDAEDQMIFQGNGLPVLAVDLNNRRVGIGTKTPASELHIGGAAPSIFLVGNTTANQDGLRVHYNTSIRWGVIDVNGTSLRLRGDAEAAGDAGTDRIAIDLTTGNVGIGATNPAAPLQLRKLTAISEGATGAGAWANFGSNAFYDDGSWKRIDATKAGVNLHINAEGGGQEFRFARIEADGSRLRSIAVLGTDRSYILEGNVGIGTQTPYAKLTLAGSLGFTNDVSPMMYIFQSGTTNPEKSIISHSPGASSWGLFYNDDLDSMLFKGSGIPVMTVALGSRVVTVNGRLDAPNKSGFVVDCFVNNVGETLEQGDVVVIGGDPASLYYGPDYTVPIPEIDLAQRDYDTRVCGIVCEIHIGTKSEPVSEKAAKVESGKKSLNFSSGIVRKKGKKIEHVEPQTFTRDELENLDRTKIAPGKTGLMVTLGAFAHCKVDADIAPINVGDLLTTSPTKGHAQKALDPAKAVGAIIGKALGSLKKGKGKIPVLVMLQ